MPISSCAVCRVLSLAVPPGIWASLSEGATARGAGAANASPFTFFRFNVRPTPMFSDILGYYWSTRRTRVEDAAHRTTLARRLELVSAVRGVEVKAQW